MRTKDKKTNQTITIGGMALYALFKAIKNGNVGAAIYALNNPGVSHIDVAEILSKGKKTVDSLDKKLRKIKTPKGENQ